MKRTTHVTVKKIKKKKKQLEDPLDEVVQENDFEDGSDQSPIRNEDIGFDITSEGLSSQVDF